MRRFLVGIVGLLMVQGACGELLVAAAMQPRLIVTPAQAYPNGTMYLSGAAFPAGRQIRLGYSCSGGSSGFGVTEPVRGPRADSHGQFAGYRLQLPKALKPGSRCSIDAGAGSSGRLTIHSNRFAVLGPSQPLNSCSAHICVKVKAFLTRVRSGAWGNIIILGWPGSRANVTVVRIGKDRHRTLHLDWQGEGAFKVWVAPGLIKGLKASVRATVTLGRLSGSGTGTFAVIPGGR